MKNTGDPLKACRRRYQQLAAECRRHGLDAAEIAASRSANTRLIRGRAWLKVRAFKPTGVALGCPLPDRSCQESLRQLCLSVDAQLQMLTGTTHAAFAMVPANALHITLVNYDHFDLKTGNRPVRKLQTRQHRAVAAIIAKCSPGPVKVKLVGLVLTPQGRLMVRGYAQSRGVFELKHALRTKLNFLGRNFPNTTHIKLGHLLVDLNSTQLRRFQSWLKSQGRTVEYELRFPDVFTPLGRLPLQ